MSCLSQRSGRFTFKSGRGNSEIYLHHGMVRHASYGSIEGEPAVAEIFRWRQGRFFFEEGIISQMQTVNRPWTHLLIDNLQKLDETMHLLNARRRELLSRSALRQILGGFFGRRRGAFTADAEVFAESIRSPSGRRTILGIP